MQSEMKFSILIPTWKNLPYLKLCLRSIEQNSTYKHQIIIYVNECEDTREWVKEQGYEYLSSPTNVGICWALNALRPLVKTDYILYMNDDMYVCPGWDKVLWEEIERQPNKMFFISATLIQPRPFFCKSVIAPANFGESVETFQEEKLLAHYMDYPHADWSGATWPPNVVHRDVWDLVVGYSIEFSPGMYSDPDFSAKLWMAGVRVFKGLAGSRVYHFEARSTGRIRKNEGSLQFLRKWGITSSSFMRNILRRGEPYHLENAQQVYTNYLRRDIWRSRLKNILLCWKNNLAHNLWE